MQVDRAATTGVSGVVSLMEIWQKIKAYMTMLHGRWSRHSLGHGRGRETREWDEEVDRHQGFGWCLV